MNFETIFDFILKKPIDYPGKHQNQQNRTNPDLKPLNLMDQFKIIFKALKVYIYERMLEGNSLNLHNFGIFGFEICQDTSRPTIHSNLCEIAKDFQNNISDRLHKHRMRPFFAPDKNLKNALVRYPGKEEIQDSNSQYSVFQQGNNVKFCNASIIAQACHFDKELVQNSLNAFNQALIDVVIKKFDVLLDFDFVVIKIKNRDIKYSFNLDFQNILNTKIFDFENLQLQLLNFGKLHNNNKKIKA
ncbi:hypothetical protein IMG5_087370, partial [Ichthyophthirius multifiliis]